MKIKLDLDMKHDETSITIHAKEWSEDIEMLIKNLNFYRPKRILGVKEDQTILLNPREIDFIYAEERKVYAISKDNKIELKQKLYELEEMLGPHQFTRFSKSVIGNVHLIQRFELSFNGNLCIYFQSGMKEYVSRKYVPTLKKLLMEGE